MNIFGCMCLKVQNTAFHHQFNMLLHYHRYHLKALNCFMKYSFYLPTKEIIIISINILIFFQLVHKASTFVPVVPMLGTVETVP